MDCRSSPSPSAGNAAGALAAYAAAAGIEAHIFMPRDVPMANYLEGIAYGAHVTLVDGLISDCARMVAEQAKAKREGWFDISTLKEPFRVEGKKTMGYELVEQLGWTYPDAVFYPTGGGVGLIGMWKAFEEMEAARLGFGQAAEDDRCPGLRLRARRPRLEAKAQPSRADVCRTPPPSPPASASPSPMATRIILEIVRESGGTVVDLPDEQILASILRLVAQRRHLPLPRRRRRDRRLRCPAGQAAFSSLTDRVVLFNTGSGLKYTDAIAEAMHLARPAAKKYPQRTPVGGIITPQ